MKVVDIDPGSPLFGYIRPGYSVVSVNGHAVQDAIDFRYKTAEERVLVRFADPAGRELEFDISSFQGADLGLVFDDHDVQLCKCNCIFCFVSQQPRGMRPSLYVKDEDYRLSFTHGNFITMSNMSEADLERVVEQRLSPLYVSVHTTDDRLRRRLLRNKKLAPIIPQLRYLGDNGITLHAQVVLCPGLNDGPQLEKTVDELASLYPGVASLAVVPVGLTRYRENLPPLRGYAAQEAGPIIDYIEQRQGRFLKDCGTRLVWPADEFYVLAGREFPARSTYEDMSQFENGVGMTREFITRFNRRRRFLTGISSAKRVLWLTGESAYPSLAGRVVSYVKDACRLRLEVGAVKNRFWGDTVTVSGLLTGQDLLRYARSREREYDVLVLPPNCLNSDDLFLDNLTLEQFRRTLGKPVVVGQYDAAATIREAFS